VNVHVQWWVDDLFVTFGVLVMIAQQAVLWSRSVYQQPTVAVLYTLTISGQTMLWYVYMPPPASFDIYYALLHSFRLARGSILASVIRIMLDGPLKTRALYVSGLFVVFYVVAIAQFIWVCWDNNEPAYAPLHPSEYPPDEVVMNSGQCIVKEQVAIYQMTGEVSPTFELLINLTQSYLQRRQYPTLYSSFSPSEPSAS
jgi:hypothetical protein